MGSIVRVRGELWTITGLTVAEGCRAVRLRKVSPGDDRDRTLIEPFDRCRPVRRHHRPRVVSRRAWVACLREALAATTLADHPCSAAAGGHDLLAYQLEPALAVLGGDATRLLLADHVGLGKTVQAAIIAAELVARHEGQRVLVVTPAGLRDQWQGELAARAGLRATICDATWLASQAALLPPDTNPWSLPGIRIVSIDFLKRSEVLNGLEDVVWDLLIVDEAHVAAPGTDRAAAVDALGRRACHVVLATATPSDGQTSRFDALCSIGRLGRGDAIAVFRRSPADAGRPVVRRTRLLRVRPTADERRMHDLLSQYLRAIEAGPLGRGDRRLVAAVLAKRSLSSARALELTTLRRRALLAAGIADRPQQAHLPFQAATAADDVDGDPPPEILGLPGLASVRHELAWLGAVEEAARRAARRESKVVTLLRLLRRTREPVIAFTEYRDTLAAVVRAVAPCAATAVLHGAQDVETRRRELRAFEAGRARVLLATDAAGEGLNLHQRCRLVVTLDLPWNPNRLEQRAGRVDRLGQTRTVHVVHLVARDTADDAMRERLDARSRAIGDALGPGPAIDSVPDQAEAGRPAAAAAGESGRTQKSPVIATTRDVVAWWPRVGNEAGRAAGRLAVIRDLLRRRRPLEKSRSMARRRRDPCGRVSVTCLRIRRGANWRREWLFVYRVALVGPDEVPLEAHLVPVVADAGPCGAATGRADLAARLRQIIERGAASFEAVATASIEDRRRGVEAIVARRTARLRARREAIERDRRTRLARALVQPGLFDSIDRTATPLDGRSAARTPGERPSSCVTARAELVLAAAVHVRPGGRGR